MTTVAFPQIDETFRAACSEVLNEYFSAGGTFLINGQPMEFYRTEIHYDIDKVRPANYPRFVIAGTRQVDVFEGNCQDAVTKQIIRTKRIMLKRTAYLSMPRQGPITVAVSPNSKLIRPDWPAINTWWSQFVTVVNTQQTKFRSRGIMFPKLVFTPVQGVDKEFLVLFGAFECTVEVSYVWE